MKAETNRRITAYKQALPHMRERVVAALLMLIIAASVTVTATYAWVTLSISPEVSKLATTLAANGNLEIALAKADGSAPDEFDVDESVGISSDDVTVTNLQWGNLVNLSDSSYGIGEIALRPARLNSSNLLGNPLWGAVYSADGRVTNLDSNYAYMKYDAEGKKLMVPKSGNAYGVRAIASYTAVVADEDQRVLQELMDAAETAHQNVNAEYDKVAGTFSALGTMISKFAGDKISSGDGPGTNLAPYLGEMLTCYEAVYSAMVLQKDAYVAMANLQIYMAAQNTGAEYKGTDWNTIYTNRNQYNTKSADTKSSNGVISLTGLTQFISDMELIKRDIDCMKEYQQDYLTNGTPYYWSQMGKDADGNAQNYPSGKYSIATIVDHLIGFYSMYAMVNGEKIVLASLNMDTATKLLPALSGTTPVYVDNGIMKRFEQIAVDEGCRLNGEAECTIKVLVFSVKGAAWTTATGACYFMQDYNNATAEFNFVPNDATAEDTYGLVIDLWLRTNAEETCLTLEGATTTDEEGNVLSYGVNRVWGETGTKNLTTNSTTQGGGSCYVYYTDSPEDMMRSLDLLQAMKVAFVDSSGTLLATANMDTENYYAVNGRVTVPLVIDALSGVDYTYIGEDNSTEMHGRAITTMYADQPIRVTAIIYLSGDLLTNDDVLAESQIQGRLNIQFGSSQALDTTLGSEIKFDERVVTADVSPHEINFDTANSDAEKTVNVTVKVDGDQPEKITAHFLRAINSTQGTQEEEMIFTRQEDGTWTTTYTFNYPGTYYLRYVTLDGVEYTLNDPQMVEVKGFALESVGWSETGTAATIRTSDSTHTTEVTVEFATNESSNQPKVVEARFVRTDGTTVNVPMRRDSWGKWNGSATFTTSGVYTLQYLVMDGKYYDLTSQFDTKTIDLSLGMYVKVTHTGGGDLSEMFDVSKTYSREVSVKIFDNTGKELGPDELGTDEEINPKLSYMQGSSVTSAHAYDLHWNDTYSWYTCTLSFTQAGIYNFGWVTLGGNTLNRCTASPVYRFISPNPPVYDTSSSCTNNDADGIQYVPMSNSAKIEGLRIKEASAATVNVVVYNETSKEFKTVTATVNGENITINLPTYQFQTGTDSEGNPILADTQEGKWHVAAIILSQCYDATPAYRDETNPIVWVDSGEYGNMYLDYLAEQEQSVTPDLEIDFSALSTTVSSQVKVSMDPGKKTALGDSTTAFGKVWYANDTGMSVTITDGNGRVIPRDQITGVVLNVNYSGNTDTSYGYAVSGEGNTYDVKLTRAAADESGKYTAAGDTWQWYYVGEYKVTSLVIAFTNGQKMTVLPNANGVPAQYTVTSAAPTASNVTVTLTQGTKDFNGTFLQAFDLSGTFVELKLTGEGNVDMSKATVPDVEVLLNLEYKGGSEKNGGYTFTTSQYSQLNGLVMTRNESTGRYAYTTKQVLLAGTYSGYVTVTGKNGQYTLDNITVQSSMPDVKITGVSPATEVTVNSYTGTDNYLTAKAADHTFKATNQFGDYYAVVYMQYASYTAENNVGQYDGSVYHKTSTEHSTDFANYTVPEITLSVANCGSLDMMLNVGDESITVGSGTATLPVGRKETNTHTVSEEVKGEITTVNREIPYKGDTQYPLGTVTISTVTSTDSEGNVYTRTLKTPIVISQLAQQNPTLTITNTDQVSISVSDGTTNYTKTTDIPAMTSLTATVTAKNGYHAPTLTQPDGVYDWKLVSSTETTATYSFKMSVGSSALTGSATKYPAITFSNGSNATVSVTVNGTAITSGTGAKSGATVVVTVNCSGNYCLPKMTEPAGVTNWTAVEGDFTSTYTFTMPAQAVSLNTPTTTAMYTVTWENTSALTFYVKDNALDEAVENGGYVVPGHTLTITVTASGGVNPSLTAPAGATESSKSDFSASYTYTMPNSAVTLAGQADEYPAVKLDNDFAAFVILNGGMNVTESYAGGIGVKPGNTVKVTLTAKDGYYQPRMDQPSGVENWKAESEDDWTATYSFTMPNAEVAAGSKIHATEMPTVTFAGTDKATMSMNYTGQNDKSLTTATGGVKVKPNTTITVIATATANYYNPTVSASGATQTSTSEGTQYVSRTYTFTVESSSVTLTASATANPTITHKDKNDGGTLKLTIDEKESTLETNKSRQVRPGTVVKYQVSYKVENDDNKSTTVYGATPSNNSFTMPANDVTITISSDSCVTEDTLITLADGTQKRVDELTGDELVLVWNMETGTFDSAPIMFVDSEERAEYEVITLSFSDSTEVKVITEHGFWDYDLNRYVYLDANAASYLGHTFAKQNDNELAKVQLVDVKIGTELTSAWSPVTADHLCYFVNGMLSMPGGIGGLFNIFDVNADTMSYDMAAIAKDIEMYGLFTYEELNSIIPLSEEMFNAAGGQYLKISIGKGNLTMEELKSMILRYSKFI